MKYLRGKPVPHSQCEVCGEEIIQANGIWIHTDLRGKEVPEHEAKPRASERVVRTKRQGPAQGDEYH